MTDLNNAFDAFLNTAITRNLVVHPVEEYRLAFTEVYNRLIEQRERIERYLVEDIEQFPNALLRRSYATGGSDNVLNINVMVYWADFTIIVV